MSTVFATPSAFQTSNENAVASLSTDGHFKIVDGLTGSTIFEKMLVESENEKLNVSDNEKFEGENKNLDKRENEKFDKRENEKFDNKSEKEKTKKEGKYFSSPVIVDDKLIVGCRDNFLYCFVSKS